MLKYTLDLNIKYTMIIDYAVLPFHPGPVRSKVWWQFIRVNMYIGKLTIHALYKLVLRDLITCILQKLDLIDLGPNACVQIAYFNGPPSCN